MISNIRNISTEWMFDTMDPKIYIRSVRHEGYFALILAIKIEDRKMYHC